MVPGIIAGVILLGLFICSIIGLVFIADLIESF